jgi:hypothetical protein
MTRPTLVFALVAILLGCNGSTNSGRSVSASMASPSPPSSSPSSPTTPSPQASQVYTISIVGTSTISGRVYDPALPMSAQIAGPLAVLVTDSNGQPVDGVNVAFRASTAQPAWWGPFGLGDTLSGDGMWTVSAAGTGVAAVGCVPGAQGISQVVATVVPVVSSAPTPFASSNTVTFEVIGTP